MRSKSLRWYGIYVWVKTRWWWPFNKEGYKCLTHNAVFTTEKEWHEHLLDYHKTFRSAI